MTVALQRKIVNLLNEMDNPEARRAVGCMFDELQTFLSEQDDVTVLAYYMKRLKEIRETEYAQVVCVYTQVNAHPTSWEHLDLFFSRPILPEQKQMARARRQLKNKVKRLHERMKNHGTKTNTTTESTGDGAATGVDHVS